MKYLIIILALITISTTSFSQTSIDTLKQIFASKTFSLEEEYIGDWGGYTHTFNFSKEGNKIRVKCKNLKLLKNEKVTDVILTDNEFNILENIFINCLTKLVTSKNLSTEHIFYKFKNENMTFIIDDKYTMECNEDFKAWKEMLLVKYE